MESWHHHSCKKKDAELGNQSPHFLSLVQTFFHGPSLCYFPIKTPMLEMSSHSPNDFDLFKSQYSKIDASGDEVVESEEYHELNQFLSKEGWILHVAKCSKSEISDLTCLLQCDDYLAPITWEVFYLMLNIQSII